MAAVEQSLLGEGALPRRGPRPASNPWLTLGRMTLRGERRPARDPRGASRRACPFVALRHPRGLPRRLPRRIRGARYCDDGRVRLREEAEQPPGHSRRRSQAPRRTPRQRTTLGTSATASAFGATRRPSRCRKRRPRTRGQGCGLAVPYYFWVAPVAGSGNKPTSDLLVEATVRDTTPPSPPGSLRVETDTASPPPPSRSLRLHVGK